MTGRGVLKIRELINKENSKMDDYEGKNYNPRRMTGLAWLLLVAIVAPIAFAVWV